MSAFSAIETPIAAADASGAAHAGVSPSVRHLRVVPGSTPAHADSAADSSAAGAQPRSSSIAAPILTGIVLSPRRPRSAAAGVSTCAAPAPLRLTRRGQIVVAVFVVAVVFIAVLLVTALASGRAQATNHGRARAGYQGMHQVVVRPGQTLWSIAAAAEPAADPRDVVQEIIATNALSSPTISADQLLWVP
ncbi:MAG TPA: LysM peptidoglycan-binding domain-containing protein [Streptosporangiaceae bacterium]|nr:LysM peptidoglycan-binding domain-containing protein [Streptosporangiaceae bacterium]